MSINQPLRAGEARKLARHILIHGRVVFTTHAIRELARDGKDGVDAVNVIRGGAYAEAEWENGGWRHRVSTMKFTIVIELESEQELVVITGWARA